MVFTRNTLGELSIKMILKCKKCENVWDYKGQNKYYATCTRCLNKVRVVKYENKEDNIY